MLETKSIGQRARNFKGSAKKTEGKWQIGNTNTNDMNDGLQFALEPETETISCFRTHFVVCLFSEFFFYLTSRYAILLANKFMTSVKVIFFSKHAILIRCWTYLSLNWRCNLIQTLQRNIVRIRAARRAYDSAVYGYVYFVIMEIEHGDSMWFVTRHLIDNQAHAHTFSEYQIIAA